MGGIAAATTAGAAYIVASTDPASAGNVETTDNVSSTVLSGASDDGRIDDVTLYASGSFEWSGLEADAKYAEICLYARGPNGGQGEYERIARAVNQSIDARSSSTEPHHFENVGGSLFETTTWTADDVPQPSNGQTATTELDVMVRVIVYENGRGVKDDTEHTVTIEITNVGRGLESETTIDGEVHTSPSEGDGQKPGGIPDDCDGFCDPNPSDHDHNSTDSDH